MVLKFPDYDLEVESKVMLDVLHLDTPALPSEGTRNCFRISWLIIFILRPEGNNMKPYGMILISMHSR